LLGYKRPDPSKKKQLTAVTVTIDDYDLSTASTSADWSTTLATAIKDQGYCGSCWAFSSVSQIESDAIRAGYLTTDDTLSEQQVVSCDTTDYGCDGGYTEYAYSYVYSAGGIVSDTDYPYTSYYDSTGKCSSSLSSETKLVTVSEYYSLDSEETMAAHVLTTGPLSVCLDASDWSTYVSGVVSSCGDDVDHCVQAVGVNTDESYWLIRNSWGTEWGMDGYILIEYVSDLLCDLILTSR
jgi:C1A family cysteine protease